MAENIIKDFVKKQTTPLTIGVPKARPQAEPAVAERVDETIKAPAVEQAAPATSVQVPTQQVLEPERGHVGRPKSDVNKVKLSVYVPEEAKKKLIKIQHHNYKPSLNDILLEAINDLLKKYDE